MAVPNHAHVPIQLHGTGLYDLTTHEGQAAFVDAVVSTLHGMDARWGHLKKKPGQTAVHGHGEDSALYLSDTPGQSQAVDFIAGAGGPNPLPGWLVDSPRYSAGDWLNPTEHGKTSAPCPPVPVLYDYPNEPTTIKSYQDAVKATYKEAGRQFPDPNDSDAFRWFSRYGFSCRNMPEPDARARHLAELRAMLGLPT